MPKKDLLHIQVKDNGLILAHKIGNQLNDLKSTLQIDILSSLISGSNANSLIRYRIAQNAKLEAFKIKTSKLISKTKKDVKTALKSDTTVNLNNKQVDDVAKEVNKGLNDLGSNAIKNYQDTLTNLFLKVKSADDLKGYLQKHIDSGVGDLGVVYKDGKNYRFDSYFEMKARTDIQNDIAKNMISAGQRSGVVFYIAAFFGDCAKDHAEFQGKIYVDEKYESIAPKDRLEEIRDYVSSKNIMTVQDVIGEKGNYLTSRPNCRHYFQYVDIDSVLGAKTEKEVSNLRNEMNLNFNGKYKPEKYEALQRQRNNERKIRSQKEEIQKNEMYLHLDPGNKVLQSKIMNGEANVRRYQADQRELIKEYDNLERSYSREALGNRVTLGTSKR